MPEEFKSQTWVCTGKALDTKRKILHIFQLYDQDSKIIEPEQLAYSVKKRNPNVGHVYEALVSDDGRLRDLKYMNRFPNDAQVLAWRTAAEAIEIKERMRRREKFEGANLPFQILAPIRETYWSTDSLGQRCIEAQILYYLRAGKKPEV